MVFLNSSLYFVGLFLLGMCVFPFCFFLSLILTHLSTFLGYIHSRKRVLKIVKEKSTYETKEFIKSLRKRMGFKIETIQVDNGPEFVNDDDKTEKDSAFEKAVKKLNMELKRTRPYSPWQNGKVERSHREDGKILYGREVFTSEKELKKKVARHEKKYNSTAKTVLDFKSPDQVVAEYFSKCNICLDS